jgi:hypothetical protein
LISPDKKAKIAKQEYLCYSIPNKAKDISSGDYQMKRILRNLRSNSSMYFLLITVLEEKIETLKLSYQYFEFNTVIDSNYDLTELNKIRRYYENSYNFYKIEHILEQMTFPFLLLISCISVFIIPNFYHIIYVPFLSKNEILLKSIITVFPIFFCVRIIYFYIINKLKCSYTIDLLVVALVGIMNGIYVLRYPEISDILENFKEEEKKIIIDRIVNKQSNITPTQRKKPINEIDIRKFLLSEIEKSSKYLEYYMPIKMSTNDEITDKWFANSMRQAAGALREKKKWVLTPKKDTYHYLSTSILATLTCTVQGNWDALEKLAYNKENQQTSTMNRIIHFTTEFFKTLIITTLAAFSLFGLQLIPNVAKGSSLDSTIHLITLWIVLSLLAKYDLNTNSKFSLFKEAKDLFK